ncbi:hypothetical protein CIK05_01540 [Bdellovibrio sp. qaytius]|nr:hypothetical protein CIK05_01540 [Bdellovibrio sp. qaytius]
MDNNNEKYFKPDNPDSAFDKFLQRKTHAPTELQMEKWEDEGGVVPEYNVEYGWYENDPFLKKVGLFFKRILEKISANVAPRHLQTKASQHHY